MRSAWGHVWTAPRLLRPRTTATTRRTTCSSTASTSALTRIRLSVQRSRVTLKRAGDSGPSQGADGQPIGRHPAHRD
jgi:hypothetical protein